MVEEDVNICVVDHTYYDEVNMSRKFWTYDETVAFLNTVAVHDELQHVKTKKYAWENVASDLQSQNIIVDANACHIKWRNLLRSYKCVKSKYKNGSDSKRFLFFDKMKELLEKYPQMNSKHSNLGTDDAQKVNLDLSFDNEIELETANDSDSAVSIDTASKRIKTIQIEYLNLKKKCLKAKQSFLNQRKVDKAEREKVKIELFKKKLELEERKIILLEKLVNLKDNN